MAGPLYREIADGLRRRIDSGEFGEGDKLPTEDELMAEYTASRNTVRNAIKELSTRGLVDTHHGKGTFVTEEVPPTVTTLTTDPETGAGGGEGLVYTAEVERSGRIASTSDPQVLIQKANPSVADALRIDEGAEVILRYQERFVDGRPWSLQTSFYPRTLTGRAPRLLEADSFEEGTVAYLRECGIRQAGYRDSIEVRTPNQQETDFFRLPIDNRILVVEIYRVAFDQDGHRVRLTITVYRADRNRFVINVGDVPVSEALQLRGGQQSAS